MAVYALVTDLEAYTGNAAPQGVDRLLQRASELLDSELVGYLYHTDPVTLLPIDADVITAFKNAVCAQVEWWIANNDELGELDQWERVRWDGAEFQRPGSVARAQRLCPRARDHLHVLAQTLFQPWITA